MTENDYIAEYIKEKYPSMLGADFAFWKFVRQLGNFTHEIVEIFKQIPIEDLSKAVADMESSNRGKHGAKMFEPQESEDKGCGK